MAKAVDRKLQAIETPRVRQRQNLVNPSDKMRGHIDNDLQRSRIIRFDMLGCMCKAGQGIQFLGPGSGLVRGVGDTKIWDRKI